jgi:hypothetical protein
LLDDHDVSVEGFAFQHRLNEPSWYTEKPPTCSVPGPTLILPDPIHRRNLPKTHHRRCFALFIYCWHGRAIIF